MFEDDYFGFARAALIMFVFIFAMVGVIVLVSQYEKEHPPPQCTPKTMGYCQWYENNS